MPWIRSLFFVFVLLMLQTASAGWGEGWDPIEPPIPTAAPEGKIEVVEFFWYGCPHCYTLDPLMEEWVAKKPDNVVFRHVPAPLNPSWTVHSQFFYAAEALDLTDKLHVPLFEALHDKHRKLFDKQSLIDFAVEHGVDRKNFTEAWNSFGVFVKVQQARKLSQRFQLDGVPAVGINGKYKTSATLAGSYPKMFKIIDELVQQESQSK